MYCTLEPCVHTGRTGPCTRRIIDAGVRRVVVAIEDPYPLVNGRGVAELRANGIQVDLGVEADAARRQNRAFLSVMTRGRPWVTVKAATSLDGRIAAAEGQRTALTSTPANLHVQYGRAVVDAIAVGVGTVLVDDPLLTARDVYRDRPADAGGVRSPVAHAARGEAVHHAVGGPGGRGDAWHTGGRTRRIG